MLKNILKLDGAQGLSKNEQKEISGGNPFTKCKSTNLCSSVCGSQNYGYRCDLHCGCPGEDDGMCNGNGGYNPL